MGFEMTLTKPTKLIGARGAGRPRELDAIDRLMVIRAADRGVSPELTGAFFGVSASVVTALLRSASPGDVAASLGLTPDVVKTARSLTGSADAAQRTAGVGRLATAVRALGLPLPATLQKGGRP